MHGWWKCTPCSPLTAKLCHVHRRPTIRGGWQESTPVAMLILVQNCCVGDSLALGTLSFPPTSWNLSPHQSLFTPHLLESQSPVGHLWVPVESQSPLVPLQRHSPPTSWNLSPHQSLFRDIHPPPPGISVPNSPSSETFTPPPPTSWNLSPH